MLPVTPHPPRSACRLAGMLAAAVLLAGCESVPTLPDIDLLPPDLFGTRTEPGSSDTPQAGATTSPVPRSGGDDWHAIDGPIFDWRAEGGLAVRALAGATPPEAGAPVDDDPGASTAAALVEPARPGDGTPPVPAAVVRLKPALRLSSTSPAPQTTPPPAWQTATGPIFDWSAESPVASAAQPEPRPPSAWQLRESQMRGLAGWRLNGRVAISSPHESWSAVLRWEQVGDAFHVRLSNPLGQGLLELRGIPGEVLLRTAEGDVYRAPDAETLLRDVAGMSLPVSGLRYWVLAVTDPAAAAAEVSLDGDSLPVALEQAGWRIEYDRYRDTGGLRLPDRLSFKGEALGGRLIVTQWELQAS